MWNLIHSNLILFQLFYMFISIIFPITLAYVFYRFNEKKRG